MKYILEYPIPNENNKDRYYTLSSCEKARYIYSVLVRLGYKVEIVSPSYTRKLSMPRIDKVCDNVVLYSGFSLGWFNKITKVLSRASTMLWLFYFLLLNCKRGETIIIYHGLQNIPIFLLAKLIKQYKYILEVEEIYSNLNLASGKKWRAWLEFKMIKHASGYIFSSHKLEERYNKLMKPSVICVGSYDLPHLVSSKRKDGKIHLVYAGLIEKNKVAFKSAEIAKFLDYRYDIHIIGYGNDSDINELISLTKSINAVSDCKVHYEGLKRGDDYNSFLQSCHIGLCLLPGNSEFQLACFPSKITSYLCNDLSVLTTKNEVLESSNYSKYLYFVDKDSPESFAKEVKKISFDYTLSARQCVKAEDERFINQMPLILPNCK